MVGFSGEFLGRLRSIVFSTFCGQAELSTLCVLRTLVAPQDLDFAYYDKVLRDVAASSQGRPENVWVVGEFDENNPLVTRLKEEHDVKIAVSLAGLDPPRHP